MNARFTLQRLIPNFCSSCQYNCNFDRSSPYYLSMSLHNFADECFAFVLVFACTNAPSFSESAHRPFALVIDPTLRCHPHHQVSLSMFEADWRTTCVSLSFAWLCALLHAFIPITTTTNMAGAPIVSHIFTRFCQANTVPKQCTVAIIHKRNVRLARTGCQRCMNLTIAHGQTIGQALCVSGKKC
jgi:hypothetical protein